MFCACCNKLPQTEWLTTTQISYLRQAGPNPIQFLSFGPTKPPRLSLKLTRVCPGWTKPSVLFPSSSSDPDGGIYGWFGHLECRLSLLDVHSRAWTWGSGFERVFIPRSRACVSLCHPGMTAITTTIAIIITASTPILLNMYQTLL